MIKSDTLRITTELIQNPTGGIDTLSRPREVFRVEVQLGGHVTLRLELISISKLLPIVHWLKGSTHNTACPSTEKFVNVKNELIYIDFTEYVCPHLHK